MSLDPYEFKYKSFVQEILPNTKRTQQLRDKKLEEERRKKAEADRLMKAKEEEAEKLKRIQEDQAKAKQQQELRRLQRERRQQEERQQISTLKGKFGNMINSLKSNNSTLDYTITGLDLHPAHVRILVQAVETNESLKGLVLTRKNLQDSEGIEIANNLKKNFVLERLELQGNRLGPQALKAFADLLEHNQFIRSIDLECNELTSIDAGQDPDLVINEKNQQSHNTNTSATGAGKDGKDAAKQNQINSLMDGAKEEEEKRDNTGIDALMKSLRNNQTLLCLNLSGNNLNKECGQMIVQMLEVNTTIISLDIYNNPKMNLHDVRKIQEFLQRNQQLYDDERYREFLERQRQWNEWNISEALHIREEAKRVAKESIDVRMEAKRQEMDENWEQQLQDDEIQRLKEIARLEKQAKQQKKKKRRGASPKKK